MRRSLRSDRVKLPRVHRVKRRGKVFKYHRVTKSALPCDVPEDHPRFIRRWTEEEERASKAQPDKAKTAKGTIAAGVTTFLASGAFKDLSDEYRPVIRRHVDAIRDRAGRARMRDLAARHIAADIDPLTPSVARARLKAWRKLCGFWAARGLIEIDVSRQVAGKKMPKSDGHREWTREDVEAFRDRWPEGTQQRLALELLQWTGARRKDAVRIGPGMIDRAAGILTFTQSKTGNQCYVPWTRPALGLEKEREALLRMTRDCRSMVFLLTEYGKPRSAAGFGAWFSAAAKDAGLNRLTAHGLRKYRMNELAEAGATVLQMQAWVGHTTLSEIEHYTRRANRRRAFSGPEQEQNVVNHPGRFTK